MLAEDAGGGDKAFEFRPCPLHPASCILLLDSADYAADTSCIDRTRMRAKSRSFLGMRRNSVVRGGKMKRTLLVLALALLCSAGCRTMGPRCGQPCGRPCGGAW